MEREDKISEEKRVKNREDKIKEEVSREEEGRGGKKRWGVQRREN